MENVMNANTVTLEDLREAADIKCMDVPENIKIRFRLDLAATREIINPSMTLVEALTSMIIARF